MGIIDRLNRLEQSAGEGDDSNRPDSIPSTWTERDPETGAMIGPPPGVEMTPGEQSTWDILLSMDAMTGPVPE